MKHLDLFSGIGGFAWAGLNVWKEDYDNIGHSEVDKYACKIYHRHFPNSKCLGDIKQIEIKERVELITAGFPCQDASIAGKREGLSERFSVLLFDHLQ